MELRFDERRLPARNRTHGAAHRWRGDRLCAADSRRVGGDFPHHRNGLCNRVRSPLFESECACLRVGKGILCLACSNGVGGLRGARVGSGYAQQYYSSDSVRRIARCVGDEQLCLILGARLRARTSLAGFEQNDRSRRGCGCFGFRDRISARSGRRAWRSSSCSRAGRERSHCRSS